MKKKRKKRNSTPSSSMELELSYYVDASSNNNYINDCLKYVAQGINYKECLIFYRLY